MQAIEPDCRRSLARAGDPRQRWLDDGCGQVYLRHLPRARAQPEADRNLVAALFGWPPQDQRIAPGRVDGHVLQQLGTGRGGNQGALLVEEVHVEAAPAPVERQDRPGPERYLPRPETRLPNESVDHVPR